MTSSLDRLFATLLWRSAPSLRIGLIDDLIAVCWALAEDDQAGQDWCEQNGYLGYTSYGSLNDLPTRYSVVAELVTALDREVAAFADALAFDLDDGRLGLDNIWVNILPEGGSHSSHIHPHTVISGTFYLASPAGASAIQFEDPRLARMMAAPTRLKAAPLDQRTHVTFAPSPGLLLLWESWLRHEVPTNQSEDYRLSISFNYRWQR